MSSTWLIVERGAALFFKAYEFHHTMAAAGGSNHHRSMAVIANGLQCGQQFGGVNPTYAGQQLMTSNDDGQEIVDIKAGQQAKEIHGPGFSGMGA